MLGVMTSTVLLVEDESKIRTLVRSYLERAGLLVVSTGSGAEALTLHHQASPDLIVLDLGLPDIAGETIAAEIRRTSATPILMLTAKAGEADRIAGLELGADDYLTKPFSPRELVLRVQAILRRSGAADGGDIATSFGEGWVVIDVDRREVIVAGAVVELTPTEWTLLTALTASPGRVFSRFELINRIRGHEFDGYERTVDSHVKNLRRKIEQDPSDPQLVTTVMGVGYRFGLPRDPR